MYPLQGVAVPARLAAAVAVALRVSVLVAVQVGVALLQVPAAQKAGVLQVLIQHQRVGAADRQSLRTQVQVGELVQKVLLAGAQTKFSFESTSSDFEGY